MIAAKTAYCGSNGAVTRWFCRRIESVGQIGRIAAALFRAQKYSTRAKGYRGGITYPDGRTKSYTDLAYSGKEQNLERLCDLLGEDNCGFAWGWRENRKLQHARFVLYVDLPQGQVSFRFPVRLSGPEYMGHWDGQHATERRVIEFCDAVANGMALAVPAEPAIPTDSSDDHHENHGEVTK